MKQGLKEIYEEYRTLMAETLAIEEVDPARLADPVYFSHFEKQVERLDTLIELYANLLAANRN